MKIITYYLPQYHEIPENNHWWGKGFTEWVNVKKALPLFTKHYQPRVPQNSYYYDLSDKEVMRWQIKLAKENGIYGFCFYHYWFNGKLLLEKPLEYFLNDQSLDIPFCMCWANESWTDGWANASASVIMKQNYGEKTEWKRHFYYLLPYFRDKRYITVDSKPIVIIYRPYLFEKMKKMLEYWEELAVSEGLPGLLFTSQRFENKESNLELYNYLDYHIEYQPAFASNNMSQQRTLSNLDKIRAAVHDVLLGYLNVDVSFRQKKQGPVKKSYKDTWECIIKLKPESEKSIPGAFVDWDNTPRHGRRGSCYPDVSPELFGYYLKKQINNVKENYNSDLLFLFAWNEWGEGGYLEPDEKNGLSYLHAIKEAVK